MKSLPCATVLLLSTLVSHASAQCVDWTPGYDVPDPAGQGLDGPAYEMTVFDDGTGEALYAVGEIHGVLPEFGYHVVRFDGTAWSNVGGAFNQPIETLAIFDDGVHGAQLYVGGAFTVIAGQSRNRVAHWDGSGWAPLAGGVALVNTVPGVVHDMVVYDDGQGPRLFVVGDFDIADGSPAPHVAAWNGSTWSSLSSGLDNGSTSAVVYDDGTGPGLYVAGGFHHAGGLPISKVARWNGSTWSALGSGPPGPANSLLAVHDDGSGTKLYAASYNGLNRWDGSTWQPIVPMANFYPRCMTSFDDGSGSGPKLYISPLSFGIGGPVALGIWDGNSVHLDGAFDSVGAYCLTVWNDGLGPALFASGFFTRSGSVAAHNFARFGPTSVAGCTLMTGTTYCFGDGSGTSCPCGNNGAPRHGCANSSNASGATLVAEGQAHLSSDTVTLRATGMTSNASLLFFQGTTQIASGLGAPFGDGLRCVGGTVVRMAVRHASAGSAGLGHDAIGDPSVSSAGFLGGTWTTRHYQAWYRDAQTFCTSATYNLTNGVSIHWAP